jgi:predicted RNA-binding Zn-ribbon protein involved in translation (DUF1610 family)
MSMRPLETTHQAVMKQCVECGVDLHLHPRSAKRVVRCPQCQVEVELARQRAARAQARAPKPWSVRPA